MLKKSTARKELARLRGCSPSDIGDWCFRDILKVQLIDKVVSVDAAKRVAEDANHHL